MPRWIEEFASWLFELLAIAVEFEPPTENHETGPPVLMMWSDEPQEFPWPHEYGGEG